MSFNKTQSQLGIHAGVRFSPGMSKTVGLLGTQAGASFLPGSCDALA